jgi:hypothetical protein
LCYCLPDPLNSAFFKQSPLENPMIPSAAILLVEKLGPEQLEFS